MKGGGVDADTGAAAERGHQHYGRRTAGLCGGRGPPDAGRPDGGPDRLRSRPFFRAVRQGRGVLRPVGQHPADRGRHHPHRQARPAPGPGTGTPPAEKILIKTDPT